MPAERRLRRRHIAEAQILRQRPPDPPLAKRRNHRRVRVRQYRLDLAREYKNLAILKIIERLLPEAIARQQEPSQPPVPKRQRKHSPQTLNRSLAVFFIKMRDRLAIALGLEAMPARLQPPPQLAIIVDLPVED